MSERGEFEGQPECKLYALLPSGLIAGVQTLRSVAMWPSSVNYNYKYKCEYKCNYKCNYECELVLD